VKKLNVVYAGWGERWHLGTLADTGWPARPILFEYSADALPDGCCMSIIACRH
jgi:serine/threonine-protein kinase HipA